MKSVITNISRISRDFLAIAADNGDGLLHRICNVNRTYYASDYDLARRVLEIVTKEGVASLRRQADADPVLYEKWDQMSRCSFFYVSPPLSAYTIVLGIHEGDDIRKMVSECNCLVTAREVERCAYRVYLKDISSLPEVWEHLVSALRERGQVPRVGVSRSQEPIPETVVSVFFIAPLPKSDRFDSTLIRLMDQQVFQVLFTVSPFADGALPYEHLENFEEDGFLFNLRLKVSPNHLSTEEQRRNLGGDLEKMASSSPTREIDIVFDPLPPLASSAQVDTYFSFLESLSDLVHGLDLDLSRISLFRLYLTDFMCSRSLSTIFEVQQSPEGYRLYYANDLTPLPQALSGPDDLASFFSDLSSALTSKFEARTECSSCLYSQFCPKSTLMLFWDPPEDVSEREIYQRVVSHQCDMHKRAFETVFDDLIGECRTKKDLTTPLKLNISPEGNVGFTNLYP
jgi:hypothetical protein